MNPAPAFSARGQRGGWTHLRKLYYEAFASLTRWARQQFTIGVERVAWEDASDLHRSSILAWHADFTDGSYRRLRDAYPDLYDAAAALGRHRQPSILQRAQAAAQGAAGQVVAPAQPQQPSTPSSPSSTTTVSTIKAAAPCAAAPSRASTESPSRRPSSNIGWEEVRSCRELVVEEDASGKASAFPCTEGVIKAPKIQNSTQGCS